MEFTEGHIITSLGSVDFSWIEFTHNAFGIVSAQDNHLAGNCLINRITDSDGRAFHHVKPYNPYQGLRLGNIGRRLMYHIHFGFPILLNFA
jgi:hypothetical protein